MPTIAISNHSTVCTDAEVQRWIRAVQAQLYGRFRRFWNISGWLVFAEAADPDWQGLILDDSDQAGALGYHDDGTAWGAPRLKVFAKTDKDNGLSPSVTLSHEVLEALVDPYISTAIQTSDTEFYALEVGDPVEADALGYEVNGVLVSDFVLPTWFIPDSDPPYSCVGSRIADGVQSGSPNVTAPLEIAAGGYASIFVSGRGWTQHNQRGEVALDTSDPRFRHRG